MKVTAAILISVVWIFTPADSLADAGESGAEIDLAGPWGDSAYNFSLKVSKSLFKTINLFRRKRGLKPFEGHEVLGMLSGSYSSDMITGDFFGHFAPDGRTLRDRLIEVNATDFEEVAELLWHDRDEYLDWRYQEVVRSAVSDWLNSSEGHRENLLDPNLRHAGVGTAIRNGRIVVTMILAK